MAEIPHKSDSKSSKTSKRDRQASNIRKVVEKTVVRVRIEENVGRLKSEGPPSDMWSWRKYGQKPIKGSPYPRGYYKCSSSKGCSAKKQVERCKTDGSMLIITYTSSHNHPDPDHHHTNQTQQSHQNQAITATPIKSPNQAFNTEEDANCNSNLQSPINSPPDIGKEDQLTILGKAHEPIALLFDERTLSHPNLMAISTPKSEENDFFDELEELPISSSFTSMMRSSFFDERILA